MMHAVDLVLERLVHAPAHVAFEFGLVAVDLRADLLAERDQRFVDLRPA